MKLNGWRRVLYGAWATVEVLLFGGLGYGWPSLVFLLKQRNVYSYLCHHDVIPILRHKNSSATNFSQPVNATTNISSLGQDNSKETNMRLLTSAYANSKNVNDSTNEINISLNETYVTYSYLIPGENVSSFLESCSDNSTDGFGEVNRKLSCADQDAAFALAYTIVTSLTSVGSVGVGHAQRYLGMRVTRIGTGVIYIAGLLMVGFVTPDRPALLITGMTSVTLAGIALLMTNVQLGALYGRARTTFVGLLSGCFDVSAIMQLLIKVRHC
ncbi:hypothetical protein ACOMHN_056669 [Nucella lapillus]